jgi:hypothetical protein
MLLSSLEAIAGGRKTKRFLTTDKGFIEKQILKDKSLFDDLFAYGTGVRNKLLHVRRMPWPNATICASWSNSRNQKIVMSSYPGCLKSLLPCQKVFED